MKSSLKFAIIGKGFIFERHRLAIEHIGGEIVMTCDINPETKPDFTDWVKMFNHPDFKKVDAVSVLTPNYLHYVMAKEALRRGKQVLVEKPITLSSRELESLPNDGSIFSVLQLRYHPALRGLNPNSVYVEAKMFRDETFWSGWKGQKSTSGGVLSSLGIHYLDLLIFLLGNPDNIINSSVTDKLATGEIIFENGVGKFHIEIVDNRERQGRKIFVDGREILLSDKDNLSYEDLHCHCYLDFVKGKGITPKEAMKSIKLIEDLELQAT